MTDGQFRQLEQKWYFEELHEAEETIENLFLILFAGIATVFGIGAILSKFLPPH